jgi:hypothetical protein
VLYQDETNVKKLEQLHAVVLREMEAETLVVLSTVDEIEALACAVECDYDDARAKEKALKKHADEVSNIGLPINKTVPMGSRLLVELGDDAPEDVPQKRCLVAKVVRSMREGDAVLVKKRPLKTCRAPPLSPFGKSLLNQKDPVSVATKRLLQDVSAAELRDRLFLLLWDAQFLTMCEVWTNDKKSRDEHQRRRSAGAG